MRMPREPSGSSPIPGGVGAVPSECTFNQEKQGLLCYEKCKDGYTGFVASCMQSCPTGYTDDGLFCRKPSTAYGRGVGYPWQFGDPPDNSAMLARCEAGEKTKCEMCLLVAYPVCKPGYEPAGCNICTPVCPPGMTNLGVSCAKDTYFRDTALPKCADGETYDAGLCYPACSPAYAGAGPVCWGRCSGATPFECAAGCAKDQLACAQHTGDMVLATINTISSLAGFYRKIPGVTDVIKAAYREGIKQTALAAGKYAVASGAKSWTKAFVKQSLLVLPPPPV
jgi:hypothetical protein